MTTKTGRPDLWGEEREWEEQHGPGELLDMWREACAALETLAEMTEGARHEMLYIALMDALKRARVEREHFEEEVEMRLAWNKAHGRLTPFGRVFKPLMEWAGYRTAAGFLYAAGRMEEPHATEILERLMHGPGTSHNLGGYLEGFPKALGLPENGEGAVVCRRLSSSLMGGVSPDLAEKAAREAEAEYAESGPAPRPASDADGPLADANDALSVAIDALEGTDSDSPEVLERKRLASQAVAEAGQLVSRELQMCRADQKGEGR